MNILSLLILIPLVTATGILISKRDQTIKMIALLGKRCAAGCLNLDYPFVYELT